MWWKRGGRVHKGKKDNVAVKLGKGDSPWPGLGEGRRKKRPVAPKKGKHPVLKKSGKRLMPIKENSVKKKGEAGSLATKGRGRNPDKK